MGAVKPACPVYTKSYIFPTTGKSNAPVLACHGALLNRGTHCSLSFPPFLHHILWNTCRLFCFVLFSLVLVFVFILFIYFLKVWLVFVVLSYPVCQHFTLLFIFFFFLTLLHLPASGQAVVTSVVPSPSRFLPSIFIAHRVQQSHCSSIFHRVSLTHALALSASQLMHKKTFPRFYTSMHSGGLELAKLTYTRLEDNRIRHRGDRFVTLMNCDCLSSSVSQPETT